jgi:hypothetical protein
MALPRSMLLAMAFTVPLLACNGDGGTGPGGNGDGREIDPNPSFSADINEIFQRRGCTASSCHGVGKAGLVLTADASANYDQLVNVPATSEDFLRVEPGNATDSYLVIKLEGRQIKGSPMPLTGSPLDNIDLTNIKNWINNGAPNN